MHCHFLRQSSLVSERELVGIDWLGIRLNREASFVNLVMMLNHAIEIDSWEGQNARMNRSCRGIEYLDPKGACIRRLKKEMVQLGAFTWGSLMEELPISIRERDGSSATEFN